MLPRLLTFQQQMSDKGDLSLPSRVTVFASAARSVNKQNSAHQSPETIVMHTEAWQEMGELGDVTGLPGLTYPGRSHEDML